MRAAREVFSELGYDAATFQAIAVRADLTRPAINHYFSSKRILWGEVVAQTNSAVVSAGIARAHDHTRLVDRLAEFLVTATQADSDNRGAAAFLVTSVLETQRHPELIDDEHDPLKNSRAFVGWAVHDAIVRGELSTDTDVEQLVEMLVAVMWGMGFYAGFIGDQASLGAVIHKLELLLAHKLWSISE